MPTLICSTTGIVCPLGSNSGDPCGSPLGTCGYEDRCSNNSGLVCIPINDCAPVLAANGCPGYAFCNNPIKNCVGGANNGNSCTFNQDCPGGSCKKAGTCVGGGSNGGSCANNSECPGFAFCGGGICPSAICCVGGDRNGLDCAYTPICTDKICKDSNGDNYNFCKNDNNCPELEINNVPEKTTCLAMGSQMCVPGGFSGTSTCVGGLNGAYCNIATCVGGTNNGGVCVNNDDCPGNPCISDVQCPEGACDRIYGAKACAVTSDCTGTSVAAVNDCLSYDKYCALDPITGAGASKLGIFCKQDSDCDGGVCSVKWCDVGPKSSVACVSDAGCNKVITSVSGSPIIDYTYVDVARSGIVPNPDFAAALWTPAFGSNPALQCPGNKRPYAYGGGAPTGDIISETGELCGVAPRIRFINKPGDPSTPVDITIGAGNSVTINFLTMIDAEQRPIRQIKIDWDTAADPDTSDQMGVGPYSDGTGLSPKTLSTDPFTFTSPPYYVQDTYTIKVMVQDNWNWCNGEADNLGYYDKQCFDKNLDSNSDTDGWLPFPGKIIVK